MAIFGLNHVGLSVRDLEAQARFWHGGLGLAEVAAFCWDAGNEAADAGLGLVDSAADCRVWLAGNAYLEVFAFRSPRPEPWPEPGWGTLTLVVSDLDAFLAAATAAGGSETGPGAVVDPDQNTIVAVVPTSLPAVGGGGLPLVLGIHSVSLVTTDPAMVAAWWSAVPEVVPVALAADQTPAGPRSRRRICDLGVNHVCVDVSDIDATSAALTAAGMTSNVPPARMPAGLAAVAYGWDPWGTRSSSSSRSTSARPCRAADWSGGGEGMTEVRRLRVEGLTKSFATTRVLDDLTFEVTGGELFGFVGSNGAGKTTTMRIVLGVLAADAGVVTFDGRPVDVDVRRRFGYMPEERGLYPKMKVRDQLVYLARLHGLDRVAAQAATTTWTERLDVAQHLDHEVNTLSLGNQQRVQLAAALVHDPDVLVLDEPFSGLDPLAVDIMSEVLRERCDAGVPVIFSSHQLDLVESLCDRVGIIRAGSLVATGTIDELTASRVSRLEVIAPAAPSGWADGIAGVRTVAHDDGRTMLEVLQDVDDQQVLTAALDTGPVHGFTRRRPRLSEVFRDAVTA